MTKTEVLAHKKAGLPVWFAEVWSEIAVKAKVANIIRMSGIEYVQVKTVKPTNDVDRLMSLPDISCRTFEDLFPSKEALVKHMSKHGMKLA